MMTFLYLAGLTLGALWLVRERRGLIAHIRHLERLVAGYRRERIASRAMPGATSVDDLIGRYRRKTSVPTVGPRRIK